MNQITTWDPFRELEEIHRRLTPLLDGGNRVRGGWESVTAAEWSPVVDIVEDDKTYVFKAELPDVKKEDVHVRVENGVLTLSGERKFEKEEKGRKFHRVERAFGTFARSFSLPDNVEADQVAANYRDGMLTITVPKAEQARPRQIDIKVG